MRPTRLEGPSGWIKAGRLRWLFLGLLLVVATGTSALWFAEHLQELLGGDVMTSDVTKVPGVEAGLVLGTSKLMPDRSPNPTFGYRLDAAAALWKAGKVKYLIVSGNHTGRYNEPEDMRDGLIRRGVPSNVIYRDGKGFRTWDSIARARSVFGLERMVVVSQRSHVARALFLARSLGIEAYGFDAREERRMSLKMQVRAYLAAVLSYYDAWRGTLPYHVGPRIAVGVDPAN